jgi:iron(II)-dependent oxidoreductase
MSPLVWDLAHIGWFEELWLVRAGADGEPSLAGFDDLYDAFRHERAERSGLPILEAAEARAYLEKVRRQTLRVLEDEPRDAYLYGLVV